MSKNQFSQLKFRQLSETEYKKKRKNLTTSVLQKKIIEFPYFASSLVYEGFRTRPFLRFTLQFSVFCFFQ